MSEGARSAPDGLAKAYRPIEFEGPIYERWLAADVFAPDGAGSRADADEAALRDHPAAPQRHRQPAPRARPAERRRGPHDAPRPDAGPPGALPARPRPRQHRRPVRPRPDHRRGRRDAGEPGSRALPRADVALHRRDPGGDPGPAAAPGRVDRLGPPPLHDGRRVQPGRARGVHPALPRGAGLPPRDAHQLVPRLPDQPVGPRGGGDARDGHALDDPLPPGRRRHGARRAGRLRHRGHHATGDDPRRHRRRRPPRRSPLRGPRRPPGADPLRRSARADHRRRGRRSGLRHGRREDHPGPRQRRLRHGAAPRPAVRRRDARRRPHLGRRRALRGAGALRGAPAHPRRPRGGRRPRRQQAARDDHGALPAQPRRRGAAPQDPVVRAHAAPGGGRPRRHPDEADGHPARTLREGLGALAYRDPRLEREPPALVGPPDPGLVLPRRPRDGEPGEGRARRLRGLRPSGGRADPGPRHLRHLVQLGALAVLDPRLAGADGRTWRATTRARSWRRPTTSSSSGWPG